MRFIANKLFPYTTDSWSILDLVPTLASVLVLLLLFWPPSAHLFHMTQCPHSEVDFGVLLRMPGFLLDPSHGNPHKPCYQHEHSEYQISLPSEIVCVSLFWAPIPEWAHSFFLIPSPLISITSPSPSIISTCGQEVANSSIQLSLHMVLTKQ